MNDITTMKNYTKKSNSNVLDYKMLN